MLDLHCHILPGIDDGARNLAESVQMAELAVAEGITHILATPHHLNRSWLNKKEEVIRLVDLLQSELDNRQIPLTIFPGQEVRIAPHLLQDIHQDEILFTDQSGKYLLVELPTQKVPAYTDSLFKDLIAQGIRPVIVHPERNHELADNLSRLKDWVEQGALSQVTAASLTGDLGKNLQKVSQDLIEANLSHFIASDAHNTSTRPFLMKKAQKVMIEKYGSERWQAFDQTTRALVNGDDLPIFQPQLASRRRFFGLF